MMDEWKNLRRTAISRLTEVLMLTRNSQLGHASSKKNKIDAPILEKGPKGPKLTFNSPSMEQAKSDTKESKENEIG